MPLDFLRPRCRGSEASPELRAVDLPCRVTACGAKDLGRYDPLGVSVYAKQRVDGHDRAQLERLCRYIMRPPLSQERLERRTDGRLELTLKNVWKDGRPGALAGAP